MIWVILALILVVIVFCGYLYWNLLDMRKAILICAQEIHELRKKD